jgi:hypothetical protein
MQIKETPDFSFSGAVESPPLEDVVVLAASAGVSLGVQRAFSAKLRSVHDDSSGVIASRCVKIPLVGRDDEISGILCRTAPWSDTRGVLSSRGPEGVRAIVGTKIAYTPSPRAEYCTPSTRRRTAPTS